MGRELSLEKIEAARGLYLRNEGTKITAIEREMRGLGFTGFNRQVLYNRRARGGGQLLGWPERFGWLDVRLEGGLTIREIRNAAKDEFEKWLTAEFGEWTWSWGYQRYIYKRLAAITKGKCRRLMIFMPPRHGKSEMVTVRYTAWRLMRDAGLNVILGSYNQRLADRFSRKIKRIVLSRGQAEQHTIASPPRPKSSTPLLRSASEWETPTGGVVRSVGAGAGIAGFGAGLIVIDDPVRNRADAESETYRDRVWEWFNDDIYTRMEPNAAIVLIQTRWHEDDLAGRLLKEMADGGEAWEVVSLPALAESEIENGELKMENGSQILNSQLSILNSDPLGRRPGDALCPARYDELALKKIKRKLGSYSFSALYQQRPTPVEGGRFKREWFRKIVDRAPENLQWKRGYDLAVSTKTSADYTASFRCAKDAQGFLYIADGFRKRIEYPDQRRFAIEKMQTEKNTEHGFEEALHGKAFLQDLRRDSGLARYAFRGVRVDTDKLTRALAWLNLAEEGKVILVRGAWIDEFVDEVCQFPAARHDDQVDAVSLAVSMIDRRRNRGWAF
ncbi:MAG: phage terminase large subunit [Pyrinomonadaceae bacterium]|nr:phage terminase large subunit [Pyrinomonadaceae bacterium]